MARPRKIEIRAKVFHYLTTTTLPISRIARLLKISKQLANHYKNSLLDEGAITEAVPEGKEFKAKLKMMGILMPLGATPEKTYIRAANARVYVDFLLNNRVSFTNEGGDKVGLDYYPPITLERLDYKSKVNGGDIDAIPWDDIDPNSLNCPVHTKRFRKNGETWTMKIYNGPKNKTMRIWPPQRKLYPTEIDLEMGLRQAENDIVQFTFWLGRTYGLELGIPEPCQKPEFSCPITDPFIVSLVENYGLIKVTESTHVDDSGKTKRQGIVHGDSVKPEEILALRAPIDAIVANKERAQQNEKVMMELVEDATELRNVLVSYLERSQRHDTAMLDIMKKNLETSHSIFEIIATDKMNSENIHDNTGKLT